MRLTVELLEKNDACKEGIEAFEALYPRGVTYSKLWHQRMLSGPLAEFEGWAVNAEVIPALIDSVGNFGTATAGHRGTATAGHRGTATAGDRGTATAGDHGTATAGDRGTAAAGRFGTATAGFRGTATAGFEGTATAGNHGTATAGNRGTATAGNLGIASAGDDGELRIHWYDSKTNRYRTSTAYVGEDRILQDTKYRLDSGGNFILAV